MQKKGFTLIEIVVVLAILAVVSTLVLRVFHTFDSSQSLSRDVSNTMSVFEKARKLTLFSRNSLQYGVHIASTTVTLFEGPTYSSGSSTNVITELSKKTIVSIINLTGGGSDVVFKRLSGEADQSGTITLQSKFDLSKTDTITIEKTGLVK